MSFLDEIQKYAPEELLSRIEAKSGSDVERALLSERLRIDDFMALLSPAAAPFIEQMAVKAHKVTRQRFGNNILLYAPLYLSNLCTNGCLYCGFNAANKVARQTLTFDEVEREARVLHERGFRHILLVTGEAPKAVDNEYLAEAAQRIRHLFSSIAIEVYPMDEAGYSRMVEAGVDGLTIYQETYDQKLYAEMHPFGRKRDYAFRLLAPERGGAAGLRRIGIGALLGLGHFRVEGFYTGLHALYLSRHFWRSHLSVSFPRMRPAEGGFSPLNPVSDREFVQLICALRLLLPDAGLVMSTRESATLRDNLLPLGITQMSAGSCTSPGGYAGEEESTRQFNIDDDRTAEEVEQMIRSKGYEAVWKDWDRAFLDKSAPYSDCDVAL
ncbi:2-iminoacetate synthase ThiH [Geobacter pelophilus]|uniref:2-iminoacetate synthase ThiH n=1 Tax=Geoanaerobacter pelophilus TaxID=60036 RepID=A0AAW4L300_9BACT|nr:2-iminoacetate synthase ThiH [Geoanaerobacter pelophilus]MBT0663368.1 2-iminoacetate synthase ThiH [Geoanaerobacter pelophilus]